MCTIVILYRPQHDWPLLIATNRDEMVSRPWLPPARHWPDRPNVTAGLDSLAGGSWLGLNNEGVVAAVNNRAGSLGPAQDKRSRGQLVLRALDYQTAAAGVQAISEANPLDYRPFNLVIVDANGAFWLRYLGAVENARVEVFSVPQGVSMLTAYDLNDSRCRRTLSYLPRFREANAPRPQAEDWRDWEALLLSRESAAGSNEAMRIVTDAGFGTVSSSLIALPARNLDQKSIWRFASRYPQAEPYHTINV